jgi:hypothetical protein
MLKFEQFDVKSGKSLTTYNPELDTEVTAYKEVEHSYLEHWLDRHGLKESAQLYVANFYEGVNDRDRLRLEAQDRFLVFTNGKKGYFTDSATASLIVNGDPQQGIEAIYAADQDAAHNMVAYGSLVNSDGMASTLRSDVRLLIIDDETRDTGGIVLNYAGDPLEAEDLDRILDKMGDGTMLVSSDLMANLRTPEEVALGISLETTVTQFRAASPDFPGIAKGTLGTSGWCEYLGVDAIVSRNDIKGDDGRFAALGIKAVHTFWVNRKSDGDYGEQSVGPQVKGTIPEATVQEFNPEMLRKGQALAAIAVDHFALAQTYIQAKESSVALDLGEEGLDPEPMGGRRSPDPIAELLKADPNGLLVGMERVNRKLEEFVRGQRVDLATNGIEVPSAMAQHHSALKPWEVANKDLPQGAIVAYYRSPLANVGSIAIAVNNHRALHREDPEAHRKEGVAYLNPWTAKQVAVTDFDRDTNGYFVGFVPTSGDVNTIAEQLRRQLADVASLPLAEQYEAGRMAIGALIEDCYANGDQAVIKTAHYPVAVTEIIEKNAPGNKPPDIIKAKKIKHDWQTGESHSAATWRAWEITANNPTGRVANAAMNLRSFAMETQYVGSEQAEQLFVQISQHYQGQIERHQSGKLVIPTDQELTNRGYPAYGFAERIKAIALGEAELELIQTPAERSAYTHAQLGEVNRLLNDFVDGPVAENLQVAVDVAKSKRGIDEDVYRLSRELGYKDHELRHNKKDRAIYTAGKLMPTNTEEPIGWGVEQANALYDGSQLHQNPNHCYYDLLTKTASEEQSVAAIEIARRFKRLQHQGNQEKYLDKNARENQQPTFTVLTQKGHQITIQRPIDAKDQERSPVWDAQEGLQPSWTVTIQANPQIDQWNPEPYTAYLQIGPAKRCWELGAIAADGALIAVGEEATQVDLADLLGKRGGKLRIVAPSFTINPPATEQIPSSEAYRRADAYLEQAVADLNPADRQAYAGVMWRASNSNSAAIKAFQPEIIAALEQHQTPTLTVTGVEYNIDLDSFDGEADRQFLFVPFEKEISINKSSKRPPLTLKQMYVYEITDPENPQKLGVLESRGLRLPEGTVASGKLAIVPGVGLGFKINNTQQVFLQDVEKFSGSNFNYTNQPVRLSLVKEGDRNKYKPSFQVQANTEAGPVVLGRIGSGKAKSYGIRGEMEIEAVVSPQPNSRSKRVGRLMVEAVRDRVDVSEIAAQLRSECLGEGQGGGQPAAVRVQAMAIAPEQDTATNTASFNPTRADLRQWFEAVVKTSPQGNQDTRLREISNVGKILNIAYCQEHNQPVPTAKAQVSTPMNYSHPNVVLTQGQDRDRMHTIALYQQQRAGRGAIER